MFKKIAVTSIAKNKLLGALSVLRRSQSKLRTDFKNTCKGVKF